MQISQMTDEQLNRAIAEKLGWKHCSDCCGKRSSIWPLPNVPHVHDPSGDVKDLSLFPNYPGDIETALALACDLKHPYQITHERVTIWASMQTDSDMVKTLVAEAVHDNTPTGIARAISEVAYMVMEGNDELG